MRLGALLPTLVTDPAQSRLLITGITADSREVRPGFAFVALPGSAQDGRRFLAEAARRGAQALLVPEDTTEAQIQLSDYERSKIPVLRVADLRGVYARALARFHPARPAVIAAVTGTNGKTSTVGFLRDLWAHAGHEARSLGTLGLRARGYAQSEQEATLTTLDPKSLHLLLERLADPAEAVTHLALEASSHALDQQRLDGLEVQAAGFSNLTRDHLDYHRSMDAYAAAKRRLFTERLSPGGVAVINADDPRGAWMAEAARARGAALIRISARGVAAADLHLLGREAHAAGQTLDVRLFGRRHQVALPVAGGFQVENWLLALGLAIGTGVALERALEGSALLEAVPGRLERVGVTAEGAGLYVDFAHTPDALASVLTTLRPHVAPGARLVCVFGAGGDRDPGKRVLMGRVVARLADLGIVTDDNPRSEDPAAIRLQIRAASDRLQEGGNRASAIAQAVGLLRAGDVLVVAGKGHEDYQILPQPDAEGRMVPVKVPFSDQAELRRHLR